jgi:hypothetical protein
MYPTNNFKPIQIKLLKLHFENKTNMEENFTRTYKSEARASPPGLSILIIAALNFFDSEEKKNNCDHDVNYSTNKI